MASRPRHRRTPPPLSQQPFLFYCAVFLVLHLIGLAVIFWVHKEGHTPVIDEALVYGSAKLDMEKVHWLPRISDDLMAAAIPAHSPDLASPPDPTPDPEPLPEPVPVEPVPVSPPVAAVPVSPSPSPMPEDPVPVIPPSSASTGPSLTELPEPIAATPLPVEPQMPPEPTPLPEPEPAPIDPVAAYDAALLKLYESRWSPPRVDRSLTVQAEVIVGENGRVIRSRIIQPSNHFLMDQSVNRALAQVIRADPLPEGVPGPDHRAVLRFEHP